MRSDHGNNADGYANVVGYLRKVRSYIPFKSNNTGSRGGLLRKAVLYYQLHRNEFLEHYHKRSNVETTFDIIKAKLRDHVRSKTEVARANEVYCKVLYHNICALQMSIY